MIAANFSNRSYTDNNDLKIIKLSAIKINSVTNGYNKRIILHYTYGTTRSVRELV